MLHDINIEITLCKCYLLMQTKIKNRLSMFLGLHLSIQWFMLFPFASTWTMNHTLHTQYKEGKYIHIGVAIFLKANGSWGTLWLTHQSCATMLCLQNKCTFYVLCIWCILCICVSEIPLFKNCMLWNPMKYVSKL